MSSDLFTGGGIGLGIAALYKAGKIWLGKRKQDAGVQADKEKAVDGIRQEQLQDVIKERDALRIENRDLLEREIRLEATVRSHEDRIRALETELDVLGKLITTALAKSITPPG